MGTTTGAIDDAIMTALQPLLHTDVNPDGIVRLLKRYAGEVTSAEAMHRLITDKTPALLVALEQEDAAHSTGAVSHQVSGRIETITRTTFIVLVCMSDTRGTNDKALKGVQPPPVSPWIGARGCYELMGLVKSKLNNLFIDGSYHDKPLMYVNGVPYYIEAGKLYVYALRFSCLFVEADAAIPTGDEVPFVEFEADFNRAGSGDNDPAQVPPPDPSNPLQNPRDEVDEVIEQ